MTGESGVRRLRGEKQQKWSNRQKMLPEVVKIGGLEEKKATKMGEKAKSVARSGEKRRLRGEKSNKNGRKGKKCCQRW